MGRGAVETSPSHGEARKQMRKVVEVGGKGRSQATGKQGRRKDGMKLIHLWHKWQIKSAFIIGKLQEVGGSVVETRPEWMGSYLVSGSFHRRSVRL